MKSLQLFRFASGSGAALDILRKFNKLGEGKIVATSPTSLRQIGKALHFNLDESSFELLEMNEAVRMASQLKEIEPMSQASQALCEAASKQACEALIGSNCFAGAFPHAGFHREVVALWQDILSHGGTEEDLLNIKTADGKLEPQLQSMVDIRLEMKLLLGRLHRAFNGDVLSDCFEAPIVEGNEYGRWLFVLGEEATPLDGEFVFDLAECGAEVWVLRDDSYQLAGLKDPLEAVFGDRDWQDWGTASPMAQLFAPGQISVTGFEIKVLCAPDILTEAEMAVRNASESVKRKESVAIYARDFEKYSSLLQSASTRLGVPLALPRRQPLNTLPNIQFFLKLLRGLKLATESEGLSVLKSGFVCLSAPEFKRAGQIWKELAEHQPNDPVLSDFDPLKWVESLWVWARKAQSAVLTKRKWVEWIQELGTFLPWFLDSEPQFAFLTEREERAKTKLMTSLVAEASIECLGTPREIGYASMVDWVEMSCAQTQMTHPWNEQGVAVWDKPSLVAPVDHLIVIGLGEGTFPQKFLENPLLSDEERKLISESSGLVVPLPTSQSEAEAERARFVRVLGSAGKRFTASYASFENERLQAPARHLSVLLDHMEDGKIANVKRSHGAVPAVGQQAGYELELLAALNRPIQTPEPHDLGATSRQHLVANAKPPWEAGIARRITVCNFQALARDLIKVQPSDSLTRFYRLLELPKQVGLVGISGEEEARRQLELAFTQFLDQSARQLPSWEVSLLQSGISRLIEGWVRREFLARSLWRDGASELIAPYEVKPSSSVAVKTKVAAKYERDGVIYLVEYLSSSPREFKKAFREADGASLIPLVLASNQVNREHGMRPEGAEGPVFGLELDFAQGDARYLCGHPRPRAIANIGDGLQVLGLEKDEFEPLFKKVATDLKKWSAEIPVEPEPGEHCQSCGFGELCRAHKDYGDAI